MDKETIINYLKQVDDMMENGKFIKANKQLKFILENLEDDLKRTLSTGRKG